MDFWAQYKCRYIGQLWTNSRYR